MRITLLGATGPTGSQILTQALERGIQVTALVRDASRLAVTHPNLTVVTGDATRADDLVLAMNNSDAVVSALGSGKSRDDDIASRAAAALVTASRQTGTRRVIWLSALGVGDSAQDGSSVQKLLWKILLSKLFADKAIADEFLRSSELNYTLIYPTTLSNKPDPGTYTAAAHVRTGLKPVSRGAVAHFMLDQLTDTAWLNATAQLAA